MAEAQKKSLTEMLGGMGFEERYIRRAFRVYEKNYGQNYNIEIITEIIIRLQAKDVDASKKSDPNKPQFEKGAAPRAAYDFPDAGGGQKPKSSPDKHHKHRSGDKAKPPPHRHGSSPAQPQHRAPPKPYAAPQGNVDVSPNRNKIASMSKSSNAIGLSGNSSPRQQRSQFKQPSAGSQSLSPAQQMNASNVPSVKRSPQSHPAPGGHSYSRSHGASGSREEVAAEISRPGGRSGIAVGDIVFHRLRDNTRTVVKAQVAKIEGDKLKLSFPLDKPVHSRQQCYAHIKSVQRVPDGAGSGASPVGKLDGGPQLSQQSQSGKSSKQSVMQPSLVNNPQSASRNSNSNGSNIPPFQAHMTLEEASHLRIRDKIDHRDDVGRFVFATVMEKQGSNLKVHYEGWSRKWDTYCDYQKSLHRFAKGGSISKRPAHRFRHLKKEDFVDLNPTQRQPGWVVGEIRRLDKESGQVQVVYEAQTKNFLYWAHLDNKDEIAEFTSRSGTDQPVQKDVEVQIKKHDKKKPSDEVEPSQQPSAHNRGQKSIAKKPSQKPRYMSPEEQMAFYQKLRAKKFPLLDGEDVDNPYTIGDWLEVQDTYNNRWITANVTDKENNWIVVHYDGYPAKYDSKLHTVTHKPRLRPLGGGLEPDAVELEIKEEMDNFLGQLKEWNWDLVPIDADGNCLYRSFAVEIYGDSGKHMQVRDECINYIKQNRDFFQNFILEWEAELKQKSQEYEWGDHVDITAMSELYNVRVRVYELDGSSKKLYLSHDQGMHDKTQHLPLVVLGRHRKKHYNVLKDPKEYKSFGRPLKVPAKRTPKEGIFIREQRLAEESSHQNGNGDDEKEDNEMKADNQHDESAIKNKSFQVELTNDEFKQILSKQLNGGVLNEHSVKAIFPMVMAKLYEKVEQTWKHEHTELSIIFLERFWKGLFGPKNIDKQASAFVATLADKVQKKIFTEEVVFNTVNSGLTHKLSENLASLINTQTLSHRASRCDLDLDFDMSGDLPPESSDGDGDDGFINIQSNPVSGDAMEIDQ